MGRSHYIDPRAPADPGLADDAADDPDVLAQEVADPARWVVGAEHSGWRLDRSVAASLPSVSRSRLQGWIEQGAARLNGREARSRDRVFAGDRIEVQAQPAPEQTAYQPEPMHLNIVHEDEALIVIDKPAGLVVHPGAGNWGGTLLNGLLAHDPKLACVPRAGIVHRLDAGTSGLMVVARSPQVQLDLVRQLQCRQVLREYWAIVTGATPPGGTIDAGLGRDPRNPVRFRVSARADARPARTHYRRIAVCAPERSAIGAAASWLACRLETGRTHQIRVHLESIGHPLIGDPLYLRRRPALSGAATRLTRQALHACRLSLIHPLDANTRSWFRGPPEDLRRLMRELGFDPERPVDPFGQVALP